VLMHSLMPVIHILRDITHKCVRMCACMYTCIRICIVYVRICAHTRTYKERGRGGGAHKHTPTFAGTHDTPRLMKNQKIWRSVNFTFQYVHIYVQSYTENIESPYVVNPGKCGGNSISLVCEDSHRICWDAQHMGCCYLQYLIVHTYLNQQITLSTNYSFSIRFSHNSNPYSWTHLSQMKRAKYFHAKAPLDFLKILCWIPVMIACNTENDRRDPPPLPSPSPTAHAYAHSNIDACLQKKKLCTYMYIHIYVKYILHIYI